MPEYRSSDDRRASAPRRTSGGTGTSASGSRPRPSGSRTSSTTRRSSSDPRGTRTASGARSSQRPSGNRYSSGAGERRPPNRKRRKKRTQPKFFLFLVIAVIIVVALLFATGIFGKPSGTVTPQPTPTANANGQSNVTFSTDSTSDSGSAVADIEAPADNSGDLSNQLDNSDSEVAALADSDRVHVTDLSLNTALPAEWKNILLLGTDERTPNESARTDAMIICSINTKTGEVKLTSIARDTAVRITGTQNYDGLYRINAVNFFGGPNYAMKMVNECLNLNIESYVTVNFFGFQKIATALGGIDVDITEAEMEEINKKQINQAWIGYNAGLDESDLENVLLETYGPNTHLNGRQTLAYARCRYVDNDMSRMERQRTVLVKLMEKLRGKSLAELGILATTLFPYVTTNMDLNSIIEIAYTVLSSNASEVDTLRIPINNSYVSERRNNKDMLYDTDWKTNASEVYNFIYY